MSKDFERIIVPQISQPVEYGGTYAYSAAAARDRDAFLRAGRKIFEKSGAQQVAERLITSISEGDEQISGDLSATLTEPAIGSHGRVMQTAIWGYATDKRGQRYSSEIGMIAHSHTKPHEVVIEYGKGCIVLPSDMWGDIEIIEEVFRKAHRTPYRRYSAFKRLDFS